MRPTLVLAVSAAVLAVPAPPAAQARVVAPVLRTTRDRQEGRVRYAEITERQGRACTTLVVDGDDSRPEAILHNGGPATWEVNDPRQPFEVTLRLVRHPVRDVPVESTRDDLEVEVTRRTAHGKTVGWTITSEPIGRGDLDLLLGVSWTGACGATDRVERAYRVFAPQPLPVLPAR